MYNIVNIKSIDELNHPKEEDARGAQTWAQETSQSKDISQRMREPPGTPARPPRTRGRKKTTRKARIEATRKNQEASMMAWLSPQSQPHQSSEGESTT